MTLPTQNDVQAIEPVLTNMLVAYAQAEARFVASRVFPAVPVDKDSGTYYQFTKKYWFTDEMKPRAAGSTLAKTGFGVETGTYKTMQFALENPIPDEVRRNSQVPMDLESAAVRFLGQKSLLRKEIAFSADFMTSGVWDNTDSNSATDWDDYASGDPVDGILTARRTISNGTGMDANTMVMGAVVHQALCNHPDVIDRIAYVAMATQANIENALAGVFGVQNYWVAKASYSNTNEATAFSASAIIDDDCLITYVAPNPGIFEASAGYTFNWAGGGGMGSIYRGRSDRDHTDWIQIMEQWDQVKVAADLGYIFLDIV